MPLRLSLLVGLLALVAPPPARAALMGITLGTDAPPATVGGFTMTPFAPDGRPLGNVVTTVPSPLGGVLVFDSGLVHARIGQGWDTWSHGYTGDVYFGFGTSLTMTLPANTAAFYFYAEPNSSATFTFTATAAGGPMLTQSIAGLAGAAGFGFFGTGGDLLKSITVTAPSGASGFAVGEFGIAAGTGVAVPAPPTLLLGLVGVSVTGLARLRRRKG
jgi:hypothetical protein